MRQLWALVHAASACRNLDRHHTVMMASDHVDIWLNIYASRGGEYCLFTAADTFGAEEAYHVREIDPAFSNLENRGTEAYNENLEIFAASKFSGSSENPSWNFQDHRSRTINFDSQLRAVAPHSSVPDTPGKSIMRIPDSRLNPNYSFHFCIKGGEILESIGKHDIFLTDSPAEPADPQCLKCNADNMDQDELSDPDLIRADQTQFWIESESVLAPTGRAADKKLNQSQRHSKCGHVGYHENCLICNQLKGSLRRVYKQSTPIYDVVIGRTWAFDSIYWSHRSRQGNKYTVVFCAC